MLAKLITLFILLSHVNCANFTLKVVVYPDVPYVMLTPNETLRYVKFGFIMMLKMQYKEDLMLSFGKQ
jgi:hypothetical protein